MSQRWIDGRMTEVPDPSTAAVIRTTRGNDAGMELTAAQQEALAEARRVLAQEKDSAAPMELRRQLLRAALESLAAAFPEDP